MPGRIHTLRMEADYPGIFAGQCTEFCGLSHANMKQDVVALNEADFATWVASQLAPAPPATPGSPAAEGEAVLTQQCVRCHQVNGLEDADGNPLISQAEDYLVPGAAPNLTHLMSRTSFAGATYSLLTPACRAILLSASPEEFGPLYLSGVSPECLNRNRARGVDPQRSVEEAHVSDTQRRRPRSWHAVSRSVRGRHRQAR